MGVNELLELNKAKKDYYRVRNRVSHGKFMENLGFLATILARNPVSWLMGNPETGFLENLGFLATILARNPVFWLIQQIAISV